MAPPAKRRKRNVFPSSSPSSSSEDGEDESTSESGPQLSNAISSSPASPNHQRSQMSSNPLEEPKKVPTKPQPRTKSTSQPYRTAPTHLPKQPRGAKTVSKGTSSSPEKPKKK